MRRENRPPAATGEALIPAIRAAIPADVDLLATFACREALEAESLTIDEGAGRRGVEAAFADPSRATYWVAETPAGEVVAATSVVREWSNLHAGYYWWVQSLFVTPEYRGTGLVERLLDHLSAAAGEAGALDLRLYVHQANARALAAYRRCGFAAAPYIIMQRSRGR